MRDARIVCFLALAALLLPASAAPVVAEFSDDDVVAEGHIAAGVFGASIASNALIGNTMAPGAEGTYGFTAPLAGLDGQRLVTEVDDPTGAGHFVQLAFRAGNGSALPAECDYGDDDHGLLQEPFGFHELAERCIVPVGATLLEVTANTGVLLDVTVRRA